MTIDEHASDKPGSDQPGSDQPTSGNPDPTMRKGPGSPKGENMPPAGGESMSPADSERPPAPPAATHD